MLNEIFAFLQKANKLVWGFPTIVLLIGSGVFLSFRLDFFQFKKLRLWLDNTLFAIFKSKDVRKADKGKNINQFQAVSTALAATIGTGNIVGVAVAVSAGGPGAVFWMWVSACFGMMTSFSENTLGIFFRRKNSDGEWCGGPMYYINDGLSKNKTLKKISKPLSISYALFLVAASFGIGNMTQANAVSQSLNDLFRLDTRIVGLILATLTMVIIYGGVKRIGSVTQKLVPFMALFYLAAAVFVFLSNFTAVPYVFMSIFKNAFSFKSVFGAAGGIVIKNCISAGFRRGVFSNEAGLGASVTVNSCSNVTEPVKQGMWGIFQVFVDTIVVCTMTAFVLLSASVEAVPIDDALKNISPQTQYVYLGEGSEKKTVMLTDINENPVFTKSNYGTDYEIVTDEGKIHLTISKSQEHSFTNIMAVRGVYDKSGKLVDVSLESVSGVSLVTLAFSSRFGKAASFMLTAEIVLFAFSTIIGWSFYGAKGAEYLFGKKGVRIYKLIFAFAAFVGAISKISAVWEISDIFNGLMVIPNLIALIALSGLLKDITTNYLKRQKGEKISPLLSADELIQFEMEAVSRHERRERLY